MTGRCRYQSEGYECELQEHHEGLHVATVGSGVLVWHDRRCRSEDDTYGRCELEIDHEGLHRAKSSYGPFQWEE
jgi:hypothetical protein